MPGHVARLVKTQISDPQALLKALPVLPQGMCMEAGGSEAGGSGPSELRKASFSFCEESRSPEG